jgi:Alr-MurF fusion protein
LHYRLTDITQIINGDQAIIADTMIEQLLLDSRKVYSPATSLFFALKGPRRDGHQFIPELYKKGVRNFIVSEKIETASYPGANFIFVKNCLDALQLLATFHRRQFSVPVIGITGSNGKTIVKEWLYQLLHQDFNIVRSPKSYNSQIGVPLSIWQMNKQHTLAIFEAGISEPDEMEKLQKIIQPTIGILTNIGEAHSENFINKKEKLIEKIKLFQNVETVIADGDNDLIRETGKASAIKFFYWGKKENNALRIISIQSDDHKTTITANYARHPSDKLQPIIFFIPFTDYASVENAITCCATLLALGYKNDVIAERMKSLAQVNMRLELKKGINNCSIINDSYSADLSSLEIALNFLDQQNAGTKKTVILSDFLQSALPDKELYAHILSGLRKHNVVRLIGIGERISGSLQPLILNADKELHIELFDSTADFIKQFRSFQFKEETILIKGARLFAFEQIVQLLEQKVHQTVLEINLNAIVHNLKEYQKHLQPSTKIMVMVKAFAYGSGGAEIAGILQYHKIDYLGVAYADEGVELRKAGNMLPIMVMNPEVSAFESIMENNLEPEIYSFELLHAFDAFLKQEGLQQYPIHIEIETGMNRLGFATADMGKLAQEILSTPSFKVQSVFSHLAASEEAQQDAFTNEQFAKFEEAANYLQEKTGYSFVRHIANSAAIIRHPHLQMDMVRLGIGLYGVDNSNTNKLNLQTVATLKSTIAQLKHLKAGESVSYNRKGIVSKDSVIATIRIGYADGYPRKLGNGIGKIWIKAPLPNGQGKLAPVIGSICMDMIMVDVTDTPAVLEGDEVIIFGNQLPVQQIAQWAETIPYEIMTGVSQRVKRIYFEE